MANTHHARCHQYVFVLWGDKFEEATAAIFTTILRKAGLRVSLVGLGGQRAAGVHGLALCSDLTLDQALLLANKAICVGVPCRSLYRLRNDPRISNLFHQAHKNNAKFIIGQVDESDVTYQDLFPASATEIATYPDDAEDLVRFACEIARSLQGDPQ